MYFRDFIVSVRAETPTRAHVSIIREVGAPLTDIIEQPPEFAHLWNQWERIFGVQHDALKEPKTKEFAPYADSKTWQQKTTLQQQLHTTFFPNKLLEYFDSLISQGGVRIIIEAADLQTNRDYWFFNTPWELMQRPGDSLPLGLNGKVSFVRRPKTRTFQNHDTPLLMPDPLRVLVITANARHEKNKVSAEQFSAPIVSLFSDSATVEVQSAASPNLQQLGAKLEQFKPHILHITGHGYGPGDLDNDEGAGLYDQIGFLIMDRRAKGGSPAIGSREFLSTLKPHLHRLRLITLASCNLARSGQGQWQQGFAAGLCDGGVPAVVAFQFELSHKAATGWATQFYESLADGARIDQALSQARNATYSQFTEGHWSDVEFGSAVLFSGLTDGRLFRRNQAVVIRSRDEKPLGDVDRDVDVLDCAGYFLGEGLKSAQLVEGADWNQTLYPLLTRLKQNLTHELPVVLKGRFHQSIAVALGYIFNNTCGFQLSYEQLNFHTKKWEQWNNTVPPKPLDGCRTDLIPSDPHSPHLIVAVSVTNDALGPGLASFKNQNRSYHSILHLTPPNGPSSRALPDTESALFLAENWGAEIKKASQQNGIRHVHLFISAPTGFALLLGMQLNACRQLQMYEFSQSGYVPSFLLAN